MDNLAVSISAGCVPGERSRWILWQISLLFAFSHFAMFALGFEGGIWVHVSQSVGPWVACGILVLIGSRMVQESFTPMCQVRPLVFSSLKMQLALAIATSLDALFVGAGLGIAHALFWQTAFALTGCVFLTSLLGFYLGNSLSKKLGRKMELIGGIVLVLLGVKILLEAKGIL